MEVNFKLSEAQYEFFTATEQQVGAVSGLGSGKSFILMLTFILNEVLKYPDALHCFAGLSNQQLTDVSQPTFENFLDDFGVAWECNKSTKTYIINGKTRVLFRSLDTADRMRSVEVGSLYIEEMSYAKKSDVMTFLGRLRDKKGSLRFRTVFTPRGFNHAYEFWVKKASPKKRLIRMSTFDNNHLPQEYVEMLQESYDSHLQRQELEGEFISVNNSSVYYMFNRDRNVMDVKEKPMTHFGMDFNVNPLTGVGAYVENDIIYVYDEMFLRNSNTYEASKVISNRFGNPLVIPDSTGASRRTSSVMSDHQILKESGLTLARVRNPLVKDRYNCVNNLLEKGRIVVHPRCERLIKDLEQMQYENKDADISHISDALGYLCWYLFPIKRVTESTSYQL